MAAVLQGNRYRTYLLSVLIVILCFSSTDRVALGLVLQDVKHDFQLSDTQLGLLTGIAFALFYSVMGIPISRWADRGNRIVIITVTTALWSVAVILCGFAASFGQLLLMRVCVAIGEAGCVPSATSLIADYYSRSERPRAMALYFQGGSLSIGVGYFLGGWLNQLYGWRTTFVLFGLPGVAIAVLVWWTLRDPRQGASSGGEGPPNSPTPTALKEVWRTLWSNHTFRRLLLFYSVANFFNSGIWQWQPAFFARSFGVRSGELGTWIAVICTSSAIAGALIGGEWAFRRAANNEPRQLRAMALAFSVVGIASSLMYLSPNHFWALGWMMLWNFAATMTPGPLFAVIQTLVPEQMRATAVALFYLAGNLIGMGVGPLVAGGLSDTLRPWFGEESLRVALLALSPGYVWAGWYLWQASKSVASDLRIARDSDVKIDSSRIGDGVRPDAVG